MFNEIPEFSDSHAEQLYNWLQIRSIDVGFHWPTEMLMLKYLRMILSTENESDIEDIMKSEKKGDLIWSKLQPHISEIRNWKVN